LGTTLNEFHKLLKEIIQQIDGIEFKNYSAPIKFLENINYKYFSIISPIMIHLEQGMTNRQMQVNNYFNLELCKGI
jgi:hypothetical protein